MQEDSNHVCVRTLDSSVAMKLNMRQHPMYRERQLIENPYLWHEFKIIKGSQYKEEEVLNTIMTFLHPVYMVPIKYQVRDRDSYFIARNCAHAIEKLCESDLIIEHTDGSSLILTIVLGFAHVKDLNIDIKSLLLPTVARRYNPKKRYLNLEAFHKDSRLLNNIYYPLFYMTNLKLILRITMERCAIFEHLNLRHNKLSTLDVTELSNLIALKYVDLRNNELMNLKDIISLNKETIVKLWLAGNPLRENFPSGKQYINSVKVHFPHIIQVDNLSVSSPNIPMTQDIYFTENVQRQIMRQFAAHFFKLYDLSDRTVLKGLYDKNAFYSITCSIPFSLAQKRKLVEFSDSRNVLKVTDPNKRDKYFYYGDDNILNALCTLPKTYHDKTSFKYDMIYSNDECLIISISGMFMNKDNESQVMLFNRTFILAVKPENEYVITNDQYNVCHVMDNNNYINIDVTAPDEEFIPQYYSPSEKKEILKKFEKVTTLNVETCTKYLEATNWDMHESLENVIKDLESKKVPKEAFKKKKN